MFFKLTNIIKIDLKNFDSSGIRCVTGMFYGCAGLTTLELGNFKLH